jgi:hypothetical protein
VSAPLAVVGREAAEALAAGAVAPVKDDALAAAARTLALMRRVGGPLGEERLGHALGQ